MILNKFKFKFKFKLRLSIRRVGHRKCGRVEGEQVDDALDVPRDVFVHDAGNEFGRRRSISAGRAIQDVLRGSSAR